MRGRERVLGVGRNEDSLKKLRSSFNECFDYVVAGPVPAEDIRSVVECAKSVFSQSVSLSTTLALGSTKVLRAQL